MYTSNRGKESTWSFRKNEPLYTHTACIVCELFLKTISARYRDRSMTSVKARSKRLSALYAKLRTIIFPYFNRRCRSRHRLTGFCSGEYETCLPFFFLQSKSSDRSQKITAINLSLSFDNDITFFHFEKSYR